MKNYKLKNADKILQETNSIRSRSIRTELIIETRIVA